MRKHRTSRKMGSGQELVYVIWDGTACKIGATKDLDRRLTELQTGNPRRLKVVHTTEPREDAFAVEAAAQLSLDESSVGGDWFHVHPNTAKSALAKAAAGDCS